MASYVFTDKAERDLELIIDYTIENWGPMQAIGYIDGLEEIAQTLADNPDIGFKRDSLSAGLLSFPYQRHIRSNLGYPLIYSHILAIKTAA